MFAASGARPHGGVKAGRHLRMIIRDGGSPWQSLRRVIRISNTDDAGSLGRRCGVCYTCPFSRLTRPRQEAVGRDGPTVVA